jgi:hypothetical protein
MKWTMRTTIRRARLVLLAVLVATMVAACGGRSTPPGASKTLGSFERGGYLFLRWQEGLDVLIWHDLAGEGTAHSVGSNAGRLYVERGFAYSADGRGLAWEVRTADGRIGEAQIAGVRYDLAAGTLFIVTTDAGTPSVRQLSRDLSTVPLDHDGILAFARNDPDLAAFMNETPATPTATPTSPPATSPATPSATPTPAPAATPSPTPTPSATPRPPAPTATSRPPTPPPPPGPAVERIRFAPGATQASIEGYLPVDGRAIYVMGVAAGQFVEIDAAVGTMGQGLRFSFLGADGTVIRPMGEAHLRTVVPSTQDYYLELVSDVGATNYRLSVLIPVRVRFAPGATSAKVRGSLAAGGERHYVLRALAGQRMIVVPYTTTGQVRMVISGADGQVLLSGRVGPPGGVFEGILPTTQDYLIGVRPEGGAGVDYALEITIPAETKPEITIEGTVMDVSPSARIITLAERVEGFAVIALNQEAKLRSAGGDEILLRDLRAGTRIQATGRPGKSTVLIANRVLVLVN